MKESIVLRAPPIACIAQAGRGDGRANRSEGLGILLRFAGSLVISLPLALPATPLPGDLDATLGVAGVIASPLGADANAPIIAPDAEVHALAIQPDGKFLVAGSVGAFALHRYHPDGTLDETFSAEVDDPLLEAARAMRLQDDGRIVVGADVWTLGLGTDSPIVVLRFESDGALDATFGNGGVVTTPSTCYGITHEGVVEQSDGKLVFSVRCSIRGSWLPFLMRYESDGAVDVTFGSGGQLSAPDAGPMAIQSDEKFLVLDRVEAVVRRHNPDGTLDPTFGVGGTATTPLTFAWAVAIQPDGKILLTGSGLDVARLNTDGSVDSSFGVGGRADAPSGRSGRGLTLQPDGKIISVGTADLAGDDHVGVVRFSSDGFPDPCFGLTGIAPARPAGIGLAAVVDTGGDVVVAGTIEQGYGVAHKFMLARYVAAGGCGLSGPCGDGTIDAGEECDDGNATAGDGCDDTCGLENGWVCRGTPSACGHAVPMASKKLVMIDRLRKSGGAKAVLVAKDAGIIKGGGTDTNGIMTKLVIEYNGFPGGFRVPAGSYDGVAGWVLNSDKVGKYSSRLAPGGSTGARRVSIKPGKLFKLAAKSLGDAPIWGAPEGDVLIELVVENGAERFVHCSRFPAANVTTKGLSDLGVKVVAKDGLPEPCF